MMSLIEFRDLLNSLSVPFYHYDTVKKICPYGIWGETGQSGNTRHASNKTTAQVIEGFVEYFTKTEYDPVVDEIQSGFNDTHTPWRLEYVDYDYDNQVIIYRWQWQITSGVGDLHGTDEFED